MTAPRILFLTRSLATGGAERQLCLLAREIDRRGCAVAIAAFYAGGALAADIAGTRVELFDLGKRGRHDIIGPLRRLRRLLRIWRPDILHGYLPAANIVAAAAVAGRRAPQLVFGIRASNMDLGRYDLGARAVYAAERLLAPAAGAIIVNSTAGLRHFASLGYPARRMTVVPNGIDTRVFAFDADGRARLRREWGIAPDELALGLAGRIDPMKGHDVFLRAAARITGTHPGLRLVCVGSHDCALLTELKHLASSLGIDRQVSWIGQRADMPAVYSALDIAVNASGFGEGFPNVVGEAMACERACVATDIGDSAGIVGAAGRVVAPNDPAALAAALADLVAMTPDARAAIGRAARQRISTQFSVEALGDCTLRVLDTLLPQASQATCSSTR